VLTYVCVCDCGYYVVCVIVTDIAGVVGGYVVVVAVGIAVVVVGVVGLIVSVVVVVVAVVHGHVDSGFVCDIACRC